MNKIRNIILRQDEGAAPWWHRATGPRPMLSGSNARDLVRPLVTASVAVAGAWVLYLGVANLALGPMLHQVEGGADLGLHYDSAYTIFPGVAHLSNVRISGAAKGGWKVSMARVEADVGLVDLVTRNGRLRHVRATGVSVEIGLPPAVLALAPSSAVTTSIELPLVGAAMLSAAKPVAAPAVKGFVIDAFESSIDSLAHDRARLHGAMHVKGKSLEIAKGEVSFDETEARIDGADLDQGDQAVLRSIVGTVSIRAPIASPPDEATPLLARTTARADVRAAIVSFTPLTSLVGLDAGESAGTLRMSGSLQRGVVASSSELRATVGSLQLADASGPVAQLDGGVSASLGESSGEGLHVELVAPRVVSIKPGDETARSTFEGVHLIADAGDVDLSRPRPADEAIRCRVHKATFHADGATLTGSLRGELRDWKVDDSTGEMRASGGEIVADDLLVAGGSSGDPSSPFVARVDLTRAALSANKGISLAGHLNVRGGDAGVLFDLVGASGAVRLALGSVEGKPFSLDASLSRDPERFALEGVDLSSDTFTAKGAFFEGRGSPHAAFVLNYGALAVGLSLHGQSSNAIFSPAAGWLAATTEAASRATEP